MTYAKRAIDVVFQLGAGTVGEGPSVAQPPITVSGFRVAASIEVVGIPSMNKASLRIYGLTLEIMNQFSRAGVLPWAQRNNTIAVNAGDAGGSMALIYGGILGHAYQDLQASPEVSFNVYAWTNLFQAQKPIDPTSYPGGADVATIMQRLATQMGYAFENNGVNVKLANPYLVGTARQQMQAVADAANVYAFIENEKTLVIIDKNRSRAGDAPLIDADHGMVGYPKAIAPGWFSIRTLFNPSIKFLGQVEVKSSIQPMSGKFRVRKIVHLLESEMPNGAWFTDIDVSIFGIE